jgi:hypothetical protein
MTRVYTVAVTQVHPGDVMLDHGTQQLVDVVEVSDTQVRFIDRSDYSGPMGSMALQDFLESFQWVRNSPVLYSCFLDRR